MVTFLSQSQIKNMGSTRIEYITELVQEPVGKILDIGCSYGCTLGALAEKADELWGIDVDQAALLQAEGSYPYLNLIHQTAAKLPFENNTFDTVILSEVIEHVGDENKQFVIDEVWRVLKKGGVFNFTAPYDGLFSWADHLDFKRRFPAIYKTYMRISNYTPSTPIDVGDKHLSINEINQLFDNRFEIVDIKFCGLFMPFINWILAIVSRLKLLPYSFEKVLNDLQAWESSVQYPQTFAISFICT